MQGKSCHPRATCSVHQVSTVPCIKASHNLGGFVLDTRNGFGGDAASAQRVKATRYSVRTFQILNEYVNYMAARFSSRGIVESPVWSYGLGGCVG